MCHLTSSGRPPLCAPIAVAYVDCWKRILPVLVTFTRSYGDVCLTRTNRFAPSVRSPLKEMKKSEHGGASFVTCIRRTLEPGVDSQHTLHTWKREARTQAVGVAIFISMFMDTQRKTHFLPPDAIAFEQARLSRMNEEFICQGTCPSQTGVGTLQFPLNSFGSVFRQPQNCKRVCCELPGNTI